MPAGAFSRRADFGELVRSKRWFVDKTMLVREFLEGDPRVHVVTAPSCFGKSTALDMIGRFAGATVDAEGRTAAPNSTENYRLFCEPPLKICLDKAFVEKHLGRYPVVRITYKPLKGMRSLKNFMRKLRGAVAETFTDHSYLRHSQEIFRDPDDRISFIRYYKKPVKGLRKESVLTAFRWLTELLFARFRRKSIVLLDDYDTFCKAVLLENAGSIKNVVRSLDTVSRHLFDDNPFLDRAMSAGTLRSEGLGAPLGKGSRTHRFLGDHRFARYFGFTETEVDGLVKDCSSKGNEIKSGLADSCGGYSVDNQNTMVYCTRSVVGFFSNTSDDSWGKTRDLRYLLHFFNLDKIAGMIRNLLYADPYIYGNISTRVTEHMLLALTNPNRDVVYNKDRESDWLTSYLFDLGCLTTHGVNAGTDVVPLRIPNEEVFFEFCDLLFHYYQHGVCYHTQDDVDRLTEVMNRKIQAVGLNNASLETCPDDSS